MQASLPSKRNTHSHNNSNSSNSSSHHRAINHHNNPTITITSNRRRNGWLPILLLCLILLGFFVFYQKLQLSNVGALTVEAEEKKPPILRTIPATATTSFNNSHTNTIRPKKSMSLGGFVFFLHVPKTGGSTVRNALQNNPHIDYLFVPGARVYNDTRAKLHTYLHTETQRRRKILFLEVHGRDAPHLLELLPTLQRYRRLAEARGLDSFYFTMLRDPMAYAMSYFNFFYVQRKNPNFPQVTPTQDHLLQYALYNPQCQFMAQGEYSLRAKTKYIPTTEECQAVQQALLETMDWVGTTEQLDTTTLPLLRQVLGNVRLTFPKSLVASKERNVSIAWEELTPDAQSELQAMASLDASLLYPHVPRQFDYDQVSNQWEPLGELR